MPAGPDPEFVIATRNRDKMTEIRAIFDGFPFPLHDLASFPSAPEVEEKGKTLEENARLKAESAAGSTGLIALADDSGLFVEALNGKPGVYSSRFAGENATYTDNNRKLIEMMAELSREERRASFVCVVAVAFRDGRCEYFRGEVSGYITAELQGMEGFGYDPVFFHPPSGKTFAELSRAEKNRVSHRYLAFYAARSYLEKAFGIG